MAKMHKKKNKHKHKFRRERKKNFKLRKLVDLTLPNSLEFKDDILRAAELCKQRVEDLCKVRKDRRVKLQMENRNIDDLIDEATQKVKDFKMCNDREAENSSLKLKSCMDFKKVVETADVILEVLDARDPLGSRCPQVEQFVLNAGKRLILVLNKIDLIPKNNLGKWLKYLRQELPTVAFKASVQTKNDNLSLSNEVVVHITESLLSTRCCVGASLLLDMLENYCKNQNIQTLVKVGVVGLPNVGKRSIIKSLEQSRSFSEVRATTYITNAIKTLSLDKHIELLDNPGIVYAKDDSSVTLALCNAVKEDLNDVISTAECIIQRVDVTHLCLHYNVPQFSSSKEFLCALTEKMGMFKNNGSPDFEDGARRLICDWNSGKIKYYANPPERFIQSEYISAELVSEMGKAFDLSLEKEQIELDKAPLLFPCISIAAKSSGPTDGLLEIGMEANNYALSEVITGSETNKENKKNVKNELNIMLTEYLKHHKLLKKRYKKMKHHKKKFNKLAIALSESIDESLTLE